MSEEVSREVQKLEARLENFLKDEEVFARELRGCLEKFRELNMKMSEIRLDPRKIEELMKLRLEAIKAFSEVLKKESTAEHEKSHLLESYGALILALEEGFQKNYSRT